MCLSRLLAPGTLHAGAGGSCSGGTQRFWGQHKVVITGGAVPSVRGAGIPTASEAARWPLPHPSWGQCHHRNRCWLRVGGPCDVAAAQPTRSQGHSSPLPGSTQKTTGDPQTPPPCPPIGHPGLGRAASPSHPPAPSGTPWNLPCPWMGVTGSVCQLCQALSSRAARSCQAALLLGAQTQNLKDCLDLLNVAAFVCFLPSVFQILRFLPSVLQIFRV